MRSPLEIIKGEFDHAIFTTYTIGLPFFERWVIPLLAGAGVRNVAVLADSAMLGGALSDPHVQLAGRVYHAHGVESKGAFHSKLILLTSAKQSRLCVSSANLTVSGQLRNAETIAAFDSMLPGHSQVIYAAGEYFRRLSEDAPPHIAEAIFDAVSLLTPDKGPFAATFRHNLDASLIDVIPDGPLEVIAPYADTAAASRLGDDRSLRVVVDGSEFEADESFFGGEWEVDAQRFGRTLHGKAYWRADGSWTMVGSPNLTSAGLLRVAAAGNHETAVEFHDLEEAFTVFDSTPWDGEPIGEAAPRRRSVSRLHDAEEVGTQFGSFTAWEDDGSLVVDGILDGSAVWYAHGVGWIELGVVEGGRIAVPVEVRPHLLRSEVEGRTAYAIVHRVSELRVRRNRRPRSERTRTLSGSLPLDSEGQRILEGVLGELFALASLVREDRAARVTKRVGGVAADQEGSEGLSKWIPANPEDEPRIPDLYHRVWAERHSVDVLLALARTALRLEEPGELAKFSTIDESVASEEGLDLHDVEEDDVAKPLEEEDVQKIETTKAVLARYRNAFMRRLDEVVDFIGQVGEQDLSDLAFQVALVQQERLALEVEVDGELVPLVEPEAILRQRLEALEAYLKRDGDDPRCLETARFHLASCLQDPGLWTAREWERLEQLAYVHGRRVLDADAPLRPVDSLLGLDPEEAAGWIESLTYRTDWGSIAEHASELLGGVSLETSPYPQIVGSASFSEISHAPGREGSPAWDVIGYGAIAGLADDDPFGVAVGNEGDGGYFDVHLLVAVPVEIRLYEAVRRRTDGRWMLRYYEPIGRRNLEDAARLGPTVLSDAYREPWTEIALAELPIPVGQLVAAFLNQPAETTM